MFGPKQEPINFPKWTDMTEDETGDELSASIEGGRRQRWHLKTKLIGGDGLMALFSARREGKDDDDDNN